VSLLPPGQRETDDFPRFGLPAYATRLPQPPENPAIAVGGLVEAPGEVGLEDLGALPRVERRSDLHCVTTWSRRGIEWGGWRFRDVWEGLLVPRARPHPEARWLMFKGLDGYRAILSLEDALADEVLLADRLAGRELPLEHGAPLRLVAPAHYGYKSIKHLCAIELRRDPGKPHPLSREHPRARVALEERGASLPGWLLRRVYRALRPAILWWYRRAG
jgi:DMSO/TMAO reductase YedYZ molybdopterin-dependent catalytic subunit